jgi:ATP synthase protein I
MAERETPPPLAELDARLQAQRGQADQGETPGVAGKASMTGFGVAFRIGAELVSALVVGVGLGYMLDRWLGTKPWLMVVFFFLGSAAGVLNVWRAASGQGGQVGFRKNPGDPASEPRGKPDDAKLD